MWCDNHTNSSAIVKVIKVSIKMKQADLQTKPTEKKFLQMRITDISIYREIILKILSNNNEIILS